MTTAKKSATKKAPAAVLPPLKGTTLMHITYHPEAGIVRANVQQRQTIAGEQTVVGRDVDIAIDALSADIRGAINDAFNWIAEDVDATPYRREE